MAILEKARSGLKKLYEGATNIIFNRLPKSLGIAVGAGAIVAPLIFIALAYIQGAKSHPSSFTVMITNGAGTGGGSGSVIETSSSESKILTNAHVCKGALKKGGKVRKITGEEHIVTGYYLSEEHDLCLITVAADLKDKVELADRAAAVYEAAIVTGHPALMPNIISKGHFGGRQIIRLITEFRKCTEKDFKDENKVILCIFVGGIPVIKTYESQVVSATIMRGSSGSAVLNSNGELSGVVFAGNADGLSYAFTVPYEAIRNFLTKELQGKEDPVFKERPWDLEEGADAEEEAVKVNMEAFRQITEQCKTDKTMREKAPGLCALTGATQDLLQ